MKCESIAASLKHRLTLQGEIQTPDGQGGSTAEWEDEADLWAKLEPLKAYERMQAMQLASPVTHRVLMRYRKGVTAAKRFRYGTRIFEIKEVINLDEASRWLRLICVETQNVSSEEP